jgi:cell division protease FtsH
VYMEDLDDAKDKVMLGTERRSMVLSETERTLVAYHEAGHAVVALRLPGLDPVHKVTIVPRGRALGLMASLPEEDRRLYPRDYLIARLAMMYGGRAAEEIVFGPSKVTTGAGDDIERATSMARRMVTHFGMSDQIGPVAVGDSEHEVFLGREIGQRRIVSESVAERVDREVKRLVNEAYETASTTLRENRELLESIAEALLERETLDRDDMDLLTAGEPLPEVRLVRQAREFADALRRERGALARAADASGNDASADGDSGAGGNPGEAAGDEAAGAGTNGGDGVAVAEPGREPGRQ